VSNLPCTICQAQVPVWDYASHLKCCVRINLGAKCDPADVAKADRLAAYQRNAMASPEHAYPPEVPTHLPAPPGAPGEPDNLSDRQRDALHKARSWYEQREHRSQVPEGRSQCACCNGLSYMYPNCSACDGRGWV
jgi:hypothetical protein